MAAVPPARRAVDRYAELINARHYHKVGDLVAEDAEFLAPTGETIRGREAIGAYTQSYRGRSGSWWA